MTLSANTTQTEHHLLYLLLSSSHHRHLYRLPGQHSRHHFLLGHRCRHLLGHHHSLLPLHDCHLLYLLGPHSYHLLRFRHSHSRRILILLYATAAESFVVIDAAAADGDVEGVPDDFRSV